MGIWFVGVLLWVVLWHSWGLAFGQTGFALGLLAAGGGAIFQISTAYHAKVTHFLECFSRCNAAYAKVNGLLGPPPPKLPGMNDGPSDAIIDYFNLCAEEYLMRKMGVIPGFVWDVWRAGIHERVHKDDLKAAWDYEVKAARKEGVKAGCLYYGFNLEQIMKEHHETHEGKCEKIGSCLWGKAFSKKNS
jgi:hypothetical protein